MLPHYLPCRVSRGAATLPHRLPLRSIPPPRFACGASASSSSVRAPQPQSFPDGPPASNKPHPAEKSTPVWLAIWRTWAGFANSQMRRAAFRCTYSYTCVPIPVTAVLSRCSDIANLSAHLHRLPTPPPYLRQMRLSPSRGRRYPISDKAAAWPGQGVWCWIWLLPGRGWSSSKSPSTDAKVNYLVIRYLYF